jgi:hypothetical protein
MSIKRHLASHTKKNLVNCKENASYWIDFPSTVTDKCPVNLQGLSPDPLPKTSKCSNVARGSGSGLQSQILRRWRSG